MYNYKMFFLFGIMFVVLINLAYAIEDRVYVIEINYDSGIITKGDLMVIPGESPDRRIQPDIGYLVELTSFNGEILYSFKFNFPLQIVGYPQPEWFDENGTQIYFPTAEEAGDILLNETTIQLVIPYFSNGKTINLYNPEGEKVLEVDVGYFAQTCNNNICEPHESYENCPQDCPSGSKDDYCDKIKDNKCDPDCLTGDIDCKEKIIEKETKFPYWILILSLTVIIIIFVFYYRYKLKKY